MSVENKRIGIWDITSRCNLRCSHCYNQERYWDNSEDFAELSTEEIETILDKLVKLSFTRVHLLGGEPLLAKNIIHLITYAKKLNLEVTIVTNGTMLDVNMFTSLCNLGVKSISISIDGTSALENDAIRGEGVFDKIVFNIKNAVDIRKSLKSDILLYFSFTLTQANHKKSHNILELAHSLGVDSVNISYLSNEGQARNDFDSLDVSQEEKIDFIDKVISDHKNYRDVGLHIDSRSWLAEYIYKKHGDSLVTDELGCKGGDKQLYILADGTLLPCSPAGTSMGACLKDVLPENAEYPNLKTSSFEDIINSPAHTCFYNYTRCQDTYKNISPCNSCKYTCTACPLLYQDYKIVDECVLAQKKIKQLDSENLSRVFSKKDNLRLSVFDDKIEILNFINQNRYIIEDIALLIWNKIDGVKNVRDISKELLLYFEGSIEYSTIEDDVLQYIYQLKSLDIIS